MQMARTDLGSQFQEQQVVHRLFSIRWTRGCMYTRIHGAADDDMTRWQIDTWSRVMNEQVIPELGDRFVSILDTRQIGAIPRGLWLALMQLGANMIRKPERRVLLAAEGWAGDNQAEATQLITAGMVRVFRAEQLDEALAFLAEVRTLDAPRIRALLS